MKKRRLYATFAGISLLLLAGLLLWAWLFSSPLKKRLTLEAGTYQLTGEEFLRVRISGPTYKLLTDLNTIDTHVPGDYPVQFLVNGETQVCLLCIRDTREPTAVTRDLVLPVGYDATPSEFLTVLQDETQVDCLLSDDSEDSAADSAGSSVTISELEPGHYSFTLLLTDAGDNRNSYPVELTVCNVRSSCQAELGVTEYPVSHYRLSEAEELSYQTDITPLLQQAGTHRIELSVDGIPTPVELVVADTTAPTVKSKKMSLWLGETAEPADFTKKISDASPVTVSYLTEPDYSRTGRQTIRLLAADSFGNTTEFESQLTIKKDTEGPELLGVRDLSFPLGTTILYRKSVFAVDNKDGEVKLQVDSSQVNPGRQGTYPVIYSAADSSGNESRATAQITITEALAITEEDVWALADKVLTELGIPAAGAADCESIPDDSNTPDTIDARQDYDILRAIYDWCRTTIHYSGISDKSSSLQAAYDGFTTHSGDCYTYYSVADMLLTRAGYDSMEIDRSGTDTFHSWNLVRYQGSWYHFDACPLLAGETFLPFLVCDEDLLRFSEDYGIRHPDAGHQNYYQFDQNAYPKRGGESIEKP